MDSVPFLFGSPIVLVPFDSHIILNLQSKPFQTAKCSKTCDDSWWL